jgi:hypothetical protein
MWTQIKLTEVQVKSEPTSAITNGSGHHTQSQFRINSAKQVQQLAKPSTQQSNAALSHTTTTNHTNSSLISTVFNPQNQQIVNKLATTSHQATNETQISVKKTSTMPDSHGKQSQTSVKHQTQSIKQSHTSTIVKTEPKQPYISTSHSTDSVHALIQHHSHATTTTTEVKQEPRQLTTSQSTDSMHSVSNHTTGHDYRQHQHKRTNPANPAGLNASMPLTTPSSASPSTIQQIKRAHDDLNNTVPNKMPKYIVEKSAVS